MPKRNFVRWVSELEVVYADPEDKAVKAILGFIQVAKELRQPKVLLIQAIKEEVEG